MTFVDVLIGTITITTKLIFYNRSKSNEQLATSALRKRIS